MASKDRNDYFENYLHYVKINELEWCYPIAPKVQTYGQYSHRMVLTSENDVHVPNVTKISYFKKKLSRVVIGNIYWAEILSAFWGTFTRFYGATLKGVSQIENIFYFYRDIFDTFTFPSVK